ncbi:MAG: polymer-forming cytoskeletal protein [Solirubrobacteraceae bacterium]
MFKKTINKNNNPLEGLNKEKNATHGEISIISENMQIKGEVFSTGSIRVDGRIEGDIKSESRIIVGLKGYIKGNIIANSVDVEGEINGKIDTIGILNIKSTAIVQAEIKVRDIAIEKGARFEGNCSYYENQSNNTIENINQTE